MTVDPHRCATGHRLIRCEPAELFDRLANCRCLAPDLVPSAEGTTRLTTRTRFGHADLELTADRGAHGSIAHLRIVPVAGPSTLLRGPIGAAYLGSVVGRILAQLDSCPAGCPLSGAGDRGCRPAGS